MSTNKLHVANGDRFDVVIIGSGIGALTTASVLARTQGKRVLILERHFKAGGFTHVFKRKGRYLWDVGIHYIGGLAKGGLVRELFDFVTRNGVDWQKMNDPFEKFVYPDFTFSVYSGEERYRSDLIQAFPDEKEAIERYFSDVKSASAWFGRNFSIKPMPPAIEKIAHLLTMIGSSSALIPTSEYMNRNIKNERLRAVLLSQWGDYGLPPSQSAFVIHALIATHYFDGGYYPVGGSGRIAESVEKILKENGGGVLLYHEAAEILVENGQAIGVRVVETKGHEKIEKTIYADAVVSNAGAKNTYLKLLPATVPVPFRDEIRNFPNGGSNVTLYIGFKDTPAKLGFRGENYWIYPSYDHDQNFERRNEIVEGRPSACYLSFPSLKDSHAEAHTAEIITFVDYEPFKKWKDEPWKKRGEEYDALKEKIAQSLIGFVDARYPGFRDLIDFYELSTPLSNEFFAGHPAGTIYGLPCTPERFHKEWAGVRTPVQNLYLTGADAGSPGVVGAMMGGYGAAASILGINGLMRLLKQLRTHA